MGDPQTQLDTTALETANKALVLIETHMAACEKDREEDRSDRASLRKDVRDGFAEVHSRINEDRTGLRNFHLKCAGVIILVLLGVSGFLFTKTMGWT